MNNIRFKIFFLSLFLLDIAEGCRVHPTKYACEYFASCKWHNNMCVRSFRGLNHDLSDVSFENFKPKLKFHLHKAKTK